jgi:phage portal protein BeeE
VFTKTGTVSDEAFDRLKEQIDENNAGAENARKALILEDDLKVDGSLMSAEDLQFLESRGSSPAPTSACSSASRRTCTATPRRPPAGAPGIEARAIGFVTYTANDWFVMWEEALERDCLTPPSRRRLLRPPAAPGPAARRHQDPRRPTPGLQWGWMSPDEVRASKT